MTKTNVHIFIGKFENREEFGRFLESNFFYYNKKESKFLEIKKAADYLSNLQGKIEKQGVKVDARILDEMGKVFVNPEPAK